MPSFINFRDVATVLTAGNALSSAGTNLQSRVGPSVTALRGGETKAITQGDDYGKSFWNDTYTKDDRKETIYKGAAETAKAANELGPNVVQAATQLLWLDALAGQAMGSGTGQDA
jgi:hypothetical protein